jgi:hypothetical protein
MSSRLVIFPVRGWVKSLYLDSLATMRMRLFTSAASVVICRAGLVAK